MKLKVAAFFIPSDNDLYIYELEHEKRVVTSFLAKFDFFAFPIDLLLLKTEKKQNLKIQSNHRDMAVESCHGHNKKSDKSHRAPTSLPNNKRGDKTLGFTTIYFTLH